MECYGKKHHMEMKHDHMEGAHDEPMYEIELDEEGEHDHDERYQMKQGYDDR